MSKPSEYTRLLDDGDKSSASSVDHETSHDFDSSSGIAVNASSVARNASSGGYASTVEGPDQSHLPANYQSSSLKAFINVTKGVSMFVCVCFASLFFFFDRLESELRSFCWCFEFSSSLGVYAGWMAYCNVFIGNYRSHVVLHTLASCKMWSYRCASET